MNISSVLWPTPLSCCRFLASIKCFYSLNSCVLPSESRPNFWSKIKISKNTPTDTTCNISGRQAFTAVLKEHRCFCSTIGPTIDQDLRMADERDDTKSPPMKSQKQNGFKTSDAKKLDQKQIATGKWISLNLITYQDPLGNKKTWEAVERTTKQDNDLGDAVAIIPTLKRMYKYDCIILVKQFRPPLGSCTIEFPAGLVDKSESLETTALRELKEETGYSGQVKHSSPVTCLDSGIGNSTVSIVSVEIDGDKKINKRPDQGLNELIEVLRVPTDELINLLNKQSKEGVIIDARVYSYAIALAHATKPPLQEKPDLSSFDG